MDDDDKKALEGFTFAAQLSGHNVQLGQYKQYDFAAALEREMRANGFNATAGACFDDLLRELFAQVSPQSRN